MQTSENAAALVGRLLLSLLFIHGGWGKLLAASATQAGFAKQGLPMVELAWVIAVAVELAGGVVFLLGLFTRPVALVLGFWSIVTALIAHTNFADRMQEINFYKNMGLAGGFLYVAAFGAGAWSLDAWLRGRRRVMPAE
ncbi:MAG: DoxX family protein [Alphaproteobacteria bacterium]|nr:DoxX family protein [Alphaproteobacteria bacterium]